MKQNCVCCGCSENCNPIDEEDANAPFVCNTCLKKSESLEDGLDPTSM